MNHPYIATRNGRFYIATSSFRGGHEKLSGLFHTREAAEKRLAKLKIEFGPAFGCR